MAAYLASLGTLQAWWDPTSDAYFTFSTGAQISAWVSRAGALGTISWGQATSANQPVRVLASASFNNKNVVSWDGTNDFFTVSNISALNCLHNASGGSLFFVRRYDSTGGANMQMFNSNAFNQSATGIITSESNAPQIQMRVMNASGTYLNVFTSAGKGVRDVTAWEMFEHAASTITLAQSGSVTTNPDNPGAGGGIPSAADPASTPILGTGIGASNPLKGLVGDIILLSPAPSATVRNNIAALLASKWGVAA